MVRRAVMTMASAPAVMVFANDPVVGSRGRLYSG
jgi:hypothetical protein